MVKRRCSYIEPTSDGLELVPRPPVDTFSLAWLSYIFCCAVKSNELSHDRPFNVALCFEIVCSREEAEDT